MEVWELLKEDPTVIAHFLGDKDDDPGVGAVMETILEHVFSRDEAEELYESLEDHFFWNHM